jgi:glutathione S-transferase
MSIVLYELCDASNKSISPYCWRVRESLLLLEIPFESRLVGFKEIHQLFTGPNKTVPILLDGEREIGGSWQIAQHLSTYHDPHNKLFGDDEQRALASFITNWVDATLLARTNRMLVKDNHDGFRPADRAYFRSKEETRQGQSLEKTQAARESEKLELQKLLHPARLLIKNRPFLGGAIPTFADCVLHSTFQWSRLVTDFELLRPDDRLHDWIHRMDDWVTTQTSLVNIITTEI